jgi:two-component system, OmpR family, phosphate regulon sensor histidine kinase PhoR
VVNFLLGLLIGLAFFWWQRSRANTRLAALAKRLSPESSDYPFSSASQLALAIAQQQRVQQQLEQEIATYRQILQTAPVSYLQVDDENRFLWCNLQAQQLLGITPDAYLTLHKPRLLLEVVRSYELDDLIEQTRDAGAPCQSEWVFYPANADPTHLLEQEAYALRGYGLPLPDRQIGIFLENRQESVKLAQQHDRWASDLAHELKTPLTSIRLVAETLHTRLEPPLQSWIDRLINETVRLSTLVQDLLDLSRGDRGAATLQLQTIDLVGLIHSVWRSLEPLGREKQLRLQYTGFDRLLIQADPPRMHRLLVNLLDNSIKYSPPQQPIWVQVSLDPPLSETAIATAQLGTKSDRQVCLEVIDYGDGFPEKALPHVFERFYRADLSRSRSPLAAVTSPGASSASKLASKPLPSNGIANRTPQQTVDWQPRGSGLGLAIVRQIVEAHHGTVQASNHPETNGAWLQVRLPWHFSEAASSEAASSEAASLDNS